MMLNIQRIVLKEKSVQSQQVYNQSTKELTGFDPQLAPPSTSPLLETGFIKPLPHPDPNRAPCVPLQGNPSR
jgi:hypothetical protein